jgi:hypothetical protein
LSIHGTKEKLVQCHVGPAWSPSAAVDGSFAKASAPRG